MWSTYAKDETNRPIGHIHLVPIWRMYHVLLTLTDIANTNWYDQDCIGLVWPVRQRIRLATGQSYCQSARSQAMSNSDRLLERRMDLNHGYCVSPLAISSGSRAIQISMYSPEEVYDWVKWNNRRKGHTKTAGKKCSCRCWTPITATHAHTHTQSGR